MTGLPTGINKIIKSVKKIGWLDNGAILDCGCGEGEVVQFLSGQLNSRKTFGLDINEKNVLAAKGKNIKVAVANLDKKQFFPLKDKSFDLILCNHVIEHLLDPDHFLKEAKRVLRNSGTLILTTPNLAAWYNRIILLLGFQPHFTETSMEHNLGKLYYGSLKIDSREALGGHIRIFTYPALKESLEINGFQIESSFGYGHPALLKSKFIGLFEYLSQLRKTLSSTLCFICKKL